MAGEPRQAGVMVVDDMPANLALLDGMLRECGYRVYAFPRGDLALKAAARNPPDLILLDINMPEMNGYQVCERLKADAQLREIPVIFISALNEALDKVRAFGAGGVDYVTKPFQFEEVQARVETHLKIVRQKRELAASYRRLQELEQLRDNLVHMMVHDMRSPLIGISGGLQILKATLGPAVVAQHGKDIDQALTATQMLKEMIAAVLDVSRMEAGQMPLNRQDCDLRQITSDALGSLLCLVRLRRMVYDPPPGPVPVNCDASVICRVIANLVANAIKFTPSKSEIRIELAADDAASTVRVSDTGPGIPPEDCGRIFEKFGQVAARQDGHKYSTGLGLTFCKLAVETHGGSIGVDSVVGKGSTFWFTLPRQRPTSQPGCRQPTEAAP